MGEPYRTLLLGRIEQLFKFPKELALSSLELQGIELQTYCVVVNKLHNSCPRQKCDCLRSLAD